jgi:hypothetical protein
MLLGSTSCMGVPVHTPRIGIHLCKFHHLYVLPFIGPQNWSFDTYVVFNGTLILETKVILLASSTYFSGMVLETES